MLLFCVRQASDAGTLVPVVVSHDGEKILVNLEYFGVRNIFHESLDCFKYTDCCYSNRK